MERIFRHVRPDIHSVPPPSLVLLPLSRVRSCCCLVVRPSAIPHLLRGLLPSSLSMLNSQTKSPSLKRSRRFSLCRKCKFISQKSHIFAIKRRAGRLMRSVRVRSSLGARLWAIGLVNLILRLLTQGKLEQSTHK